MKKYLCNVGFDGTSTIYFQNFEVVKNLTSEEHLSCSFLSRMSRICKKKKNFIKPIKVYYMQPHYKCYKIFSVKENWQKKLRFEQTYKFIQ